MENKQHSLDDLFSIAKNESPTITLEQTETLFTATVAAKAANSSVWLKFINLFKNPFIMIGISSLVLTTMLVVNTLNPNTKNTETHSESTMVTTVEKTPKQSDLNLQDDKELMALTPNPRAVEYEKAQASVSETVISEESITNLPEASETMVVNESDKLTDNESNYYVPSAAAVSKKEVRFTITDQTTKEELNAIKAKAEAAGVLFDFKMHLLQKSMKRLKLELKTSESLSKVSLSFSGPFTTEIGWELDENGKAIQFSKTESEEE